MAADIPNENGGGAGRDGAGKGPPKQESLPFEIVEGPAAAESKRTPAWLETMERRAPDRPRPPEVAALDGARGALDGRLDGTLADASAGKEAPGASDDIEAPAAPAAEASSPAVPAPPRRRAPSPPPLPGRGGDVDDGIARLRDLARHHAHNDAEAGIPGPDLVGATDAEVELRDRCRAFFERWITARKRETLERVSGAEERASEKLGRLSLGIDRFQRLTNELVRLKARYSIRRDEVTKELTSEGRERPRGIPTKVYAAALLFLGIVEFFANGPVFSALLPRDPLTERQIRVLTEMSEGWFAGVERVLAHLVFRPDAALLAAGVITFLCVLCHFFGSSLRELVMQRERKERRYTVQGRSALENIVPIVLTSIGLILVLAVLYESRIMLGEVGEERYVQDIEQVEELRREAGWLRVDGELLAANELTNRANDLQEAAVELREYASAMARMSFPILLLNLTLVLCAISAAYFHRRDSRREHFNELPFEDERREFIELAEGVAEEVSRLLADVVRDIRELKSLTTLGPAGEWRAIAHQLESVVTHYRTENGRARGIDPRTLPAFREPATLDLGDPDSAGLDMATRTADDYERERAELSKRFNEVRMRFNEESSASW